MNKMLSLLCCLAMLMVWLPVLPATAAQNETLLKEDFESYKVGEDSFYEANTEDYIYYSSFHGSSSDASYATYGIATEQRNQFLRLSSYHEKANWFLTKDIITGPYTMRVDIRMNAPQAAKATPSFIINPFQGNSFGSGKPGLIYFDPLYGVRFADAITSGSDVNYFMKDSSGANFKPVYGTWYTFKIAVEVGKVTLSVWDRGSTESNATVLVWQSPLVTAEVLNKGNQIRIQNMARRVSGAATVTDLDNLVVTGTGTPAQQPSTGTVGGDVGKNKWVLFEEKFESYKTGADTFFEADKDHYTFYSSYHGTPANANYATYGIANDGGSKVLDLSSHGSTNCFFLINSAVSGSHSIELDFQLKNPGETDLTSTMVINPFQGHAFSTGTVMVYIDGKIGLRITDETSGKSVHSFASVDGNRYLTNYGTWYTLRLTAEQGKLTAKVWQRGGDESTAGIAVVNNTQITNALNNGKGNSLRLQVIGRNQAGCTFGGKVDNLKIYKPFGEISVQSVAFGVPGSELVLNPSYTGQDLSAQSPAPQYKWTLADAQMGSVNEKGKLVLGPKQGQTKLTMELLDLRGNPTGITCATDLVVGTSNGVTPDVDQLKLPESAIGSSRKVNLTFSSEVKAKYPNPTVKWTSSNQSVAKVSADGTISFVGFGAATVTGMVTDNGKDTIYYVNIAVQLGETPLRVLSVGNSYGRDSLYYLSNLAALYGKRVEACYLEKGSGTLRQHARNVALDRAEYSYWKSNPMTGVMTWQETTTIGHAMEDGEWDVILLQQGPEEAGLPTTFNTDLDFLLDYLADVQPQAKIYWNMTWAYQQNIAGSRTTNFKNYFNGSQAIMYNAIVNCMDRYIVGSGSQFGARFDGWLPVGAAVQNLRTTMGDTITRDGFHMSLQAGRLVAAMTVLKTLYPEVDLTKITPDAVKPFLVTNKTDINSVVETDPDYANTEANMAKIRAAVEAACKDLSKAPAKIAAPAEPRIEDDTKQGDITINRVDAPLKLHFPDVTVLRDGTVLVSAYEHIFHVPQESLGEHFGKEGSGRLVIWKSTDNGRTYREILSIDEPMLEKWGIATTSNRYERWKKGETDYTFIADARDPNFGLVYFDITGDGKEDEVILYTFDMVDYHESRRGHTLGMTWSIDGGKTWAKPQIIRGKTSSVVIKRGDIASFSDGQINVPTYLSGKIYLLLMDWDPKQQQWVLTHETIMPDFDREETGNNEFNEMSLIAPDPDGNVIYGYIRANGTVVKSNDRGRTWELIGNEPGLIHQPGFAYIDENRFFVTWARVGSPRTVYGKVFYYNGDWTDTATRTIYASPVTSAHDMADPSCKLMANGEIITVSYDVAYRSIIATFDDPNSSEFALVEMSKEAKQAVLYENKAPGGSTHTVSVDLHAAYTAHANVTFAAGGKLTVKLGNGTTITFTEGQDGIVAGTTYNVAALTNGSSNYKQVWADGAAEGDKWLGVKSAQGAADGKIVYTGTNVTLNSVKVTTRVSITMPKTIQSIAGGPDKDLAPFIQPVQKELVWTTSDPKVATVKDGVVSFISQGRATITLNAGGAVATCEVLVEPQPPEIQGMGEKKVIFTDDFSQYNEGTNAFWNALEANGYKSNGSDPNENRSYNILSENGNKYLQLTSMNGKATWHKVDVPIVGDYTVQYDFLFTGARTGTNSTVPGHYLYMNLWQDSGIHGFLDLTPEGIRCEYQNDRAEVVNDPESFHEEIIYPLNVWHSIRVARVNGAIYARVWPKGETEPEKWDLVCMHSQYRTDNKACFRMQYYAAGPAERSVFIDNLVITRCEDK